MSVEYMLNSDIPEKVPLNLQWLQKPWVAFVHTRKNHRIYFVNLKNGKSLWAEEFFDTEDVPESISRQKYVGECAGNNFLFNSEKNVGNQEPMDVSSPKDCSCRTEAGVSSEAAPDIHQKNFIAIGVFDTSSLLDYYEYIPEFLKIRVACVIPFVVLRELDGLTKSTEDLKKRAKYVNSDLSRLASSFEEGLSLESSIDSEASLFIKAYNGESIKFVGAINDDKVLKTALSVHQRVFQSGGETENVFLITEDRNLTSKGISHGLNVYSAENFAQLIRLNVNNKNDDTMRKVSKYTEMDAPRTLKMNSTNDSESSYSLIIRNGPNDVEFKERKSERHESFHSFSNETEKFLFLFKTAVDVAIELINTRGPSSELLRSILRRLSQLCKMFFENNYEHVTFSAIITVVESLYCDCIALLSSKERIIRKTILSEVAQAGRESVAVDSIKSFHFFFESLLL